MKHLTRVVFIILLLTFGNILFAAPQAPVDSLVRTGVALLDAGSSDKAITVLEQAVKAKSKHPEANYYLGIAYYKKSDFEKSLKYLKNALKFNYDPIKTHIALGDVYQTSNNKQDALLEYYQAIKLSPKSPALHSKLGDVYLQNRTFALADSEYTTALKYDSLFAPGIVGHGNLAKYKGQIQDAEKLFEKAKSIAPTYAPTYLFLGRLYSEMGQFKKSLAELMRYTELMPNDPEGYKAVSEIYTQFKGFDSAIVYTNKAIAAGDTSTGSLRFLGYLYLRAKKPVQAKEALKQAIARSPDDVNGWIDLGKAYMQSGDSAQYATDAFSHAYALDSFSISTFAFDFGIAFYQAAKYDSAAEMYSIKIRLDTMAAGAYVNRALAYIQIKKYDEAVKDLEKGVMMKPDYAQWHLWLAQLYAFQNKIKQARTEFNTVLKLDPKNKDAKDGLAKLVAQPTQVIPQFNYQEEEQEDEQFNP